jgi:NAD(P)-dependent dehydrogenase (short-subunit alcohol dehydrogenase family)
VHGQVLDVGDPAACRAAVAACQQRHGSLDILVNNAGIAESTKFLQMTPEHWHRHMSVDVEAAVWLVQAALPSMVERGFGRVVSVGSLAAHLGFPYVAAYVAAKHALLGLTRAWAAEFARTAVTFNCVSPYYVKTDLADATIDTIMARTGRPRDEASAHLMTPQGRIVEPDEVADMCVYLCSDAARSVTGQSLGIDGGRWHT